MPVHCDSEYIVMEEARMTNDLTPKRGETRDTEAEKRETEMETPSAPLSLFLRYERSEDTDCG